MIVTLEGIDASGKATQTKKLVESFKESGREAERFDFPRYQTKVGDEILGVLTQKWFVTAPTMREGHDGHPETVLVEDPAKRALVLQALMTVNRYEHYDYLKHWSEQPEDILVLDRYYGSGIVYGECDGLDREFLIQIHKALPQPNAWVFVDIPVEESVRRRPIRRDEYETREGFLEKVRETYLNLFKANRAEGLPWYVIDGVGTEDEVHTRILQALTMARIR